ncbi:MAG: sel1 repeat family protein [Henriciella sp.]|nr:sel1 repeat family protein [Henriciella sp.]
MIVRLFASLCCALALAATASAQFGKPQPTPKNADEYFAERAMRDAARLTFGVEGREVIKDEDGVDLARAEARMEEAFAIYERLCADRTLPRDQWARNCYALGEMHRRGSGTEQDYAEAKIQYDAACFEGRHAEACNQQAYISQKENDGSIDLDHARALYVQACGLDDPRGCAGLGNMMYMGLGGTRDRPTAVRLLQESCADEFEWACTRLVEYGLPTRLDRY